MNKIILTILTIGLLLPKIARANDISLESKSDIKALIDEVKDKSKGMDVKTDKGVDINVDIILHTPYPQHPPYPYPQPGYQQNIIKFESGEFNYASDAEDSFNAALQQLKERGYTILESRLNWNKYIINFIAPNKRLERYVSGQYTFISDAEDAIIQTVNSLKERGYVILEQRINSDRRSFTISYLASDYSPYPPGNINFESGEFNYASDADDSFNSALQQLQERGYTILESRLNWNKYIINFIAPNNKVERYVSGQYTFISDAEDALFQTVNSLKEKGYVILEQRINSDRKSFTISYLVSVYSPYPEPYPNPYPQPYNPYPDTSICGKPNVYGTPVLGGGCNVYGCWLPGGSCNAFGCSRYGECTPYGCPLKIESRPCER